MTINLFYGFVVVCIINIRAYYLMYKDKRIAIQNATNTQQKMRLSEAFLLKTALMGGFIGVHLAMLPPLKHKYRKRNFWFMVITCWLLYSLFITWVYSKWGHMVNWTCSLPG